MLKGDLLGPLVITVRGDISDSSEGTLRSKVKSFLT